jgi:hypothetical protein
MISIIDLVLTLLSSVLSSATTNKLPGEIIAGVQSAINALTAVQNTPVTFSQLEGLRATPTWTLTPPTAPPQAPPTPAKS